MLSFVAIRLERRSLYFFFQNPVIKEAFVNRVSFFIATILVSEWVSPTPRHDSHLRRETKRATSRLMREASRKFFTLRESPTPGLRSQAIVFNSHSPPLESNKIDFSKSHTSHFKRNDEQIFPHFERASCVEGSKLARPVSFWCHFHVTFLSFHTCKMSRKKKRKNPAKIARGLSHKARCGTWKKIRRLSHKARCGTRKINVLPHT